MVVNESITRRPRWQTKVLLDADHIRAIAKGLDRLQMSRTDLACRLGIRLSALSKMLCYDRDAGGWLMPKTIYVQLKYFLKIIN